MSEDFAAMAAPSEEHALMAPFVGTFGARVKRQAVASDRQEGAGE